MKNIFLLFILALTITNVACKKSGGHHVTPDTTTPFPIFITASVNGTAWSADSGSAVGSLLPYANDSGRYNLTFRATRAANGSEIDLYITNYTGVGSYPVNPPAVTAVYYINTVRHFATSGQIDITSSASTDTVKGDFNFVADSITVTNGGISMVL